ncbi:MAG: hypothetical protein HXK92_05825, partial [Lachnospiraceae bacterium]|nr:hypothetical protein [Lachnospiraceae bacterium]
VRGVSEKESPSYDRAIHLLLSSLDLNLEERNVLLSHQFYLPHGASVEEIERSESEIRTVGNIDEVDAEVLSAFDYAALGHIHKPTLLGSPHIRYSGTPLPTSLSEAGQKKGVVMVELGEKNPIKGTSSRITILPLTPLREIRKLQGGLQDVLKQRCDDYVSVLLTDSFALRPSETFATPAEASASPASKSSPAEAGAMETEASVSRLLRLSAGATGSLSPSTGDQLSFHRRKTAVRSGRRIAVKRSAFSLRELSSFEQSGDGSGHRF